MLFRHFVEGIVRVAIMKFQKIKPVPVYKEATDKDKCKTIAGKAVSKMFRHFLMKNAL